VLSTHFSSRIVASTCLDVLAAEVVAARDGHADIPPVIKLPGLPALTRIASLASTSVTTDSSEDSDEDDGQGYETLDAPHSKARTSASSPVTALVCCHLARGGLRYVVPVSASGALHLAVLQTR
jgi:hypothetical protein